MRYLRKLKYISTPSKFLLFINTFWIVFKVQLFLRFVNLFDIPKRLTFPENKKARIYIPDELIRFINFIIIKVFRSKNTCIIRSIVLYHFYQRMGIKSKISIGVRKQNSGLLMHAWLGDEPVDAYPILYTFPNNVIS